MSTKSNQVVSTWTIAEAMLQRSVLMYRGERLSRQHSLLVQQTYSLWYLSTDDLLLSVGYTREDIDVRWLNCLSQIDVSSVFACLKEADRTLLGTDMDSYETFKQFLRQTYPFVGDILSPMKRVFASWFKTKDHDAFSICHCWLSFPSRLNLPGLAVLKDDAMRDYLAKDVSLLSDGFSEEEGCLIKDWYPRSLELVSYFEDHFEPKHGNGGTADAGKFLGEKYLHLGSDPFTSYLDGKIGDKCISPRPRTSFNRCAKLEFVPKSMLTYRSISMEPATLMWYQQGVLRAFADDLNHRKKHPLHNRFHPSYQQPNRDLAWEGSINGSFATIDLSSASDSVSWALVKRWFSETVLYRWLLCTRSNRVQLPDGSELVTKKYAPMGSALCFPIECIIFAAITECAIKESGGDPATSRYRVYGDDIVVESEYAPSVIARLIRNGFDVNTSKSFYKNQFDWIFRESCGGEYLDGIDVTPTRISRSFSGLDVDYTTPGRILSLVELANDCISRLPSVRRRCIASLNSLRKDIRVRYNSTGEGGLFSTQPTNWHLNPAEWSDDYQSFQQSHGYYRVKYEKIDHRVEDIRLFEYLRQTHHRERLSYPEDRIDVNVGPLCAGKWTRKRSPVEEE